MVFTQVEPSVKRARDLYEAAVDHFGTSHPGKFLRELVFFHGWRGLGTFNSLYHHSQCASSPGINGGVYKEPRNERKLLNI